MSKMMSDCWLSPYGDVHVCVDHEEGGNTILDDLGLNELFNKSRFFPLVDCFLESLGYVKYSTNQQHPDWCITSNTRLTQAQIDKIYELTGEVFEDKNLLWPCLWLCAVIFLTNKKNGSKEPKNF